ncbi:MAG: SUMF1/EgtB/PvdO family nonheme iron enzyme [Verrucomicrobiae bacterium]|nr:SUMF1/EgtB/PvdO family nonheme iron enzyme [Verrucomicrobiae bacterium]
MGRSADDSGRLRNHDGREEKEHLTRHCNWAGADIGGTSAVGLFPESHSGSRALDMAGNVWEWCFDWFEDREKYRVLRGGSWALNNPVYLHAAYRFDGHPGYRVHYIGFRVVCVGELR